ncbi:protein-tyrosine phosphatase-like protein [Mycena olivaceomarginata]|nr:protein-tyrosine phosphatase-like protein [Mycena olivaceomarginata]
MIAFDSVPREEMEAMCTPMHRILSPTPGSKPAATGALYLGSMAAVHDLDVLRDNNITHLVQVLEVPWMPQSGPAAEFSCHRIDIEDAASATLQPHLASACDYIRGALRSGENVLVHCQQGVSRSASIVIAYLIREHSMTYDAAFTLVKQRRRCIKPNAGFVKTLREWETACRSTLTSTRIPRPSSR